MLHYSYFQGGSHLECDRKQIDRVIETGLKEERQNIFQKWSEYLLDKDWSACETCPALLIHTLSQESKHRIALTEWYNKVSTKYEQEKELLRQMLSQEQNPFQKEQLKLKKPELDEWKALQLHDFFYAEFKNNNLIDAV